MKKILGILVIAGALVACNNDAENTDAADSPATVTADTNTVAPPPVPVDTTGGANDTTGRDTTGTK